MVGGWCRVGEAEHNGYRKEGGEGEEWEEWGIVGPSGSSSDLQYDITGFFWIDPKCGYSMDAFQVHCGFEDGGCAICIDTKEWVSVFSHKNNQIL